MTVLQAIKKAKRIRLAAGSLVLDITKKQARDAVSQGYRWAAEGEEGDDFLHYYDLNADGALFLRWREP